MDPAVAFKALADPVRLGLLGEVAHGSALCM